MGVRYKSFKKLKKHVVSRALPLLLAALMVLPSAPLTGISAGEDAGKELTQNSNSLVYDYDTLKLTVDGEQTKELSIFSYEKIEVGSVGITENATYQWQIKHPEKNNLWVDIYDAKSDNIGVSVALINNMLAEDGTAKIRLRAYTDDYAYLSNTLTVSIKDEQPSEPTLSAQKYDAPHAMAGETSETPEFVTVTINYVRYDYYKNIDGDYVLDTSGTPAFTSYVATLLYGGSLENQKVTLPTIIGYNAFLCDHSTPDHSVGNNVGEIIKDLTLNYTNITENITLQVDFLPADVNYSVRYFFQNIYDDLYIEDTDAKVNTKGPTGSEPDEALMKKPFDGFTPLFHQPDTIAADGSTMFEVYYERNYYLMEFDCAGGYGVETLYVRYGSYISIPNPSKAGYVFDYWNILNKENSNGTKVDLEDNVEDINDKVPATMPPYNSAYEAVWITAETTYSIVYWIKNENGTKTYIGSRPVSANSADVVSGSNDLTASTNLCGLFEHEHSTSDFYTCGKTEHKHSVSNGCYGPSSNSEHSLACYTDQNLEKAEEGNYSGYKEYIKTIENPEEGYIYRLYLSLMLHNFIYIGNTWYFIDTGAGENIRGFLWSGTNPSYYGNRVEKSDIANIPQFCNHPQDTSNLICTISEHSHSFACIGCELSEHTHTASCKNSNVTYMEFIEADENVLVEGDGSTIVNVYYRYKIFEIRFLYARKNNNTGNYEIANSTDKGVIEGSAYVDGGWSQQTVTALPAITDNRFTSYSEDIGIYTYYYIALRARYGENIESRWPSSAIGSTGNMYFGSWAAEAGSGYRGNDPAHANIVGPFPYMNEAMMVPSHTTVPLKDNNGNTVIDEATGQPVYLAQRMGAWWGNSGNNISKHVYHIYFETTSDTYDRIYEGKKYVLKDSLTFTAAHNTNTRVDPFTYNGFVCVNDTREHGYDHTYDYQKNSSLYKKGSTQKDEEGHLLYNCPTNTCDYCNCFYYDRSKHKFSLYNYNAVMEGKGNNEELYDMSLSSYEISDSVMQNNYYPEGIEPGAYAFGGWYTTPECLEGTKVNWDTLTMPDGDLTVYAKWTPILRNVTFYTDYNDIPSATNPGGTPFLTATGVPHGSLLGTAYYEIPDKGGEYQFVGWFYMDEDNKKRFAPDSMEITRDLVLFAEWQTGIDTEYEVQYKLGESATIGGNTYPAGTIIGDTDSAHSSVGKTKTFNAKGGTQLYPDFRKSIFPRVNSHSILMEPDKNLNNYVFEYVYDDQVYYKVRYVDYSTRTEIAESVVKVTDEAIVTEKFLPIKDYMPMPHNYYITKALMTDGKDGNASNIKDENVITFYYIKDTEHGLYSIEYYVENLDSSGTEINDSNYETITEQDYHLHQSIVNMADLNAKITADIISIDGYEYQTNFVVTYDSNGDPKTPTTKSTVTTAGKTTITGTDKLEYTGLSIKIYYKRITYPYVIKFVDSYSHDILGYGKLDATGNIVTNTDGTPKVFESINDINTDKAKFEKTISYTAPATLSHDGSLYVLNGEATKERKISAETVPAGKTYNDLTNNVIVFYYNQKQVTVKYTAVCKVPGAVDFGRTSISSEIAATVGGLGGSEAIELVGYYFAGWYTDAACTVPVDSSWVSGMKMKPQTLDQTKDVIEYYALFKPVSTDLTIVKAGTGLDSTDSFLFHIKGQDKFSYIDYVVSIQGSGSVVIEDIPQATYTITELTGWSWEYDIAEGDTSVKTITLTATPGTVTFTNEADSSNWLNGEANDENVFN